MGKEVPINKLTEREAVKNSIKEGVKKAAEEQKKAELEIIEDKISEIEAGIGKVSEDIKNIKSTFKKTKEEVGKILKKASSKKERSELEKLFNLPKSEKEFEALLMEKVSEMTELLSIFKEIRDELLSENKKAA